MTQAQRDTTALAKLIKSRREALGLTYRTASAASEGAFTHTYLHKLENGDKPRLLKREIADGLSAALQIPAEAFIAASMADMRIGEFVLEESKARAVYDAAKTLPPGDLDILLAMIHRMRPPSFAD